MNDSNPSSQIARPRRPAWNKGKLTGSKPPLRPGHVWSIRAKLQLERRTRDLAMFNLAIDSKLRGCDLVALRVDDVGPMGTRSTEQLSARGKPAGPSVSNSLRSHARRWTTTYERATGKQANFCSLAGVRINR